MHRELITAFSQEEARDLVRAGWLALEPRDQKKIDGPDLPKQRDCLGVMVDKFTARMQRAITE